MKFDNFPHNFKERFTMLSIYPLTKRRVLVIYSSSLVIYSSSLVIYSSSLVIYSSSLVIYSSSLVIYNVLAGEVVSLWVGHSLSGTITSTVYTHYSAEFQMREAEKVLYPLPV